MEFAAATKLSDGTTTSAPGPQPTASNARWSAAVPFATANACFAPQNRANSCSSSATRGPMLHQPDRTTDKTAFSISTSTSTSESGTSHVCCSGVSGLSRGGGGRPARCVVAMVLDPSCGELGLVGPVGGRGNLGPRRDGLLVVFTPTDVEPEAVVAVGADGRTLSQQRLHEIREVEVAGRRDVVQHLWLEHVDPHAHRRRHLGLLDVCLHTVPAAVLPEMQHAVVDLDRSVARGDRQDVALAAVVADQSIEVERGEHVAVHGEEGPVETVDKSERRSRPEGLFLSHVGDLDAVARPAAEHSLDQV